MTATLPDTAHAAAALKPGAAIHPDEGEHRRHAYDVQAIRQATPAQFHEAPPPPPYPPPPPPPDVQVDATPQIAAVYTAAQLQRALHSGVRDIEIRAHLDLRPLPLTAPPPDTAAANDAITEYGYDYIYGGTENADLQLGHVRSSTRSIRVRARVIDQSSTHASVLRSRRLGRECVGGKHTQGPVCPCVTHSPVQGEAGMMYCQ